MTMLTAAAKIKHSYLIFWSASTQNYRDRKHENMYKYLVTYSKIQEYKIFKNSLDVLFLVP